MKGCLDSLSPKSPSTSPSQRFYGPSMKQSGALSAGSGPTRGTKTLGWFMAETDLFEKKNQYSSDESNEKPRVVSAIGEEKKKQRRTRKAVSMQGGMRKDIYASTQTMSESSEEGYDDKRFSSQLAEITLSAKSSANPTTTNDEYWFYDVASDGYYYEQNGAKGWRRRMPNVANSASASSVPMAAQKQKENNNGASQKIGNLLTTPSNLLKAPFLHNLLIERQQQHQQQQQQQQQQNQNEPQQPSIRYYDPNSDGFYYEMASVDGWKRRQPNKPLSASVPGGMSRPFLVRQHEQNMRTEKLSSYGAALAKGQMPRNCVIEDSSASSSISGDTALQDLFGYDPTYPSISRPNSLNIESKRSEQINPNFNADQFIRDLPFAGLGETKVFATPATTTSGLSWAHLNRGCSLWNSPVKSTNDDEAMYTLSKDLGKIWAAPTPVSGLNA